MKQLYHKSEISGNFEALANQGMKEKDPGEVDMHGKGTEISTRCLIRKSLLGALLIMLAFIGLRMANSRDLGRTFTRIRVDYKVYYWAGRAVLEGMPPDQGPDLARKHGDESLPFLYPPCAGILFVPLAIVSIEAGQALFFALYMLPGFLVVLVCAYLLSGRGWVGQIVITLAFFRPIQQTVVLGQIHLFTVALLSLAYVFMLRDRIKAAGILAGIVALIKPTDAVVWALFALLAKPRALLWTSAACSVCILATLPITGPGAWYTWLGKLAELAAFRAILIPWAYTLCFAPVMALAIRGAGRTELSG